jgi:hypothetical protein
VQLQSASGAAIGSPISIQAGNTAANTSGGSYGIVNISPNAGGNKLAVSATFALPTCASYQINWGDSTAITTQTGACQNGGTTVSATHTYAASGAHSIKLNDGNGAVQATGSITITP